MKMGPFTYHRPTTLENALALLGEHGDEAKVLAGGQSLIPVMAMRLGTPAHVIDIGRIVELDTIAVDDIGIEVGALVRQADAETSSVVGAHAPLVARALPWIGHRAIRNRGTVCGSIAHADPAAELPAVALALDAVMLVASTRGRREIAAADFFLGYLTTALAEDELLVGVRFPRQPIAPPAGTVRTAASSASPGEARELASVVELSRRHGDFALAGVATALSLDASGLITAARLAAFGVGDTPVRLTASEVVLVGQPPGVDLFAAAATAGTAGLTPPTDDHATGAYRRHITAVLIRRGLQAALGDPVSQLNPTGSTSQMRNGGAR